MRHGTFILLSAAALGLAACGHKDSDATANVGNQDVAGGNVGMAGANAGPTSAATGGQGFANTAAASDAFEIATSKLAAANGKSPAIKSFASKMITAHTESTQKLKAAASSAKPAITPDPTLSADQQQRVEALKGKTGADFDKAYAAEQVNAHQATLDALKSYSASGDVPELKALAAKMVPTVTAHLNMAKGLKP